MNVEELASGVWRWSAGERWCVYVETEGATVLVDPVVPDEPERFFRALDRDVERRGVPLAVVCTTEAAAEAALPIAERYGVPVTRT